MLSLFVLAVHIPLSPESGTDDATDDATRVDDAGNPFMATEAEMEAMSCPITKDIMVDPVVLIPTGRSFERSAIETWLVEHPTDPIDRTAITGGAARALMPNRALAALIEAWVDARPGSAEAAAHAGLTEVHARTAPVVDVAPAEDPPFPQPGSTLKIGVAQGDIASTGDSTAEVLEDMGVDGRGERIIVFQFRSRSEWEQRAVGLLSSTRQYTDLSDLMSMPRLPARLFVMVTSPTQGRQALPISGFMLKAGTQPPQFVCRYGVAR